VNPVEVAIVGYGPVGQALAGYLGSAGVSVAVFERDRYVFERARTGAIDDEAMRFLQHLGVAERILEGTRVPGDFEFLTADGQLLLSWACGEWGRHGYARLNMWHQPDADLIIREAVDAMPNVAVRLQHVVEELRDDGDSVHLRAVDSTSGESVACEAKYVVGCDGGRSLVRRFIGATMGSLADSERWVVVDLTLTRDVPSLPEESRHLCDPKRPVTFIRNVGQRRRWEFMVLPDEDSAELERPENVWGLLRPWLTRDDAEIYRSVGYTFHAVLADRWRSGRALIAGDAAHLMPPFLGQGLCGGFRDVRNLSWKLAAVIKGLADEALLDTYESERAPHVREFIELSVSLGNVIQTLDPAVAAKRDAQMLSDPDEPVSLPVPQIGPGLLSASAEPPLGTPFPQPTLEDGRLLDVVSGERFTLLGLPSLVESLDGSVLQRLADGDVAVIADGSSETREALRDLDSAGVLIRPDRYVLATVDSATELPQAVELIPWRRSATLR
jgi:3-(3-hydroxy-phenyl)propionate hydroxylase